MQYDDWAATWRKGERAEASHLPILGTKGLSILLWFIDIATFSRFKCLDSIVRHCTLHTTVSEKWGCTITRSTPASYPPVNKLCNERKQDGDKKTGV